MTAFPDTSLNTVYLPSFRIDQRLLTAPYHSVPRFLPFILPQFAGYTDSRLIRMGGADFRAVVQKKLSVNLIIFIEKEMDYAAADTDIIHRPEARLNAVQSGQDKTHRIVSDIQQFFPPLPYRFLPSFISTFILSYSKRNIYLNPLPLLLCPPGFFHFRIRWVRISTTSFRVSAVALIQQVARRGSMVVRMPRYSYPSMIRLT